MTPSRSGRARLTHAVHPFDVTFVSLLAVSALPVPSGVAAAVWIGLMIAVTSVVRHRSKERAAELSRAFLVSPRARGRRLGDRPADDDVWSQ